MAEIFVGGTGSFVGEAWVGTQADPVEFVPSHRRATLAALIAAWMPLPVYPQRARASVVPSFAPPGGGGGGTVVHEYTSGSGTEVAPAGAISCFIEMVAGGGGGGCRSTIGGGGGSSGSWATKDVACSAGDTASYAVGSGGIGDSNPAIAGNGTDGGNSTAAAISGFSSFSTITCNGGIAATTSVGATGPVAGTGGNTNDAGTDGSSGPDGPGGFSFYDPFGNGGSGGDDTGSAGANGSGGMVRFTYTIAADTFVPSPRRAAVLALVAVSSWAAAAVAVAPQRISPSVVPTLTVDDENPASRPQESIVAPWRPTLSWGTQPRRLVAHLPGVSVDQPPVRSALSPANRSVLDRWQLPAWPSQSERFSAQDTGASVDAPPVQSAIGASTRALLDRWSLPTWSSSHAPSTAQDAGASVDNPAPLYRARLIALVAQSWPQPSWSAQWARQLTPPSVDDPPFSAAHAVPYPAPVSWPSQSSPRLVPSTPVAADDPPFAQPHPRPYPAPLSWPAQASLKLTPPASVDDPPRLSRVSAAWSFPSWPAPRPVAIAPLIPAAADPPFSGRPPAAPLPLPSWPSQRSPQVASLLAAAAVVNDPPFGQPRPLAAVAPVSWRPPRSALIAPLVAVTEAQPGRPAAIAAIGALWAPQPVAQPVRRGLPPVVLAADPPPPRAPVAVPSWSLSWPVQSAPRAASIVGSIDPPPPSDRPIVPFPVQTWSHQAAPRSLAWLSAVVQIEPLSIEPVLAHWRVPAAFIAQQRRPSVVAPLTPPPPVNDPPWRSRAWSTSIGVSWSSWWVASWPSQRSGFSATGVRNAPVTGEFAYYGQAVLTEFAGPDQTLVFDGYAQLAEYTQRLR